MSRGNWGCECIQDFVHVIEASSLKIHGNLGVTIIETPETLITYRCGQVVKFGTKRKRNEFMKAHAGKFIAVEV
jgi:hypothetical protein